MDTRRFLAAILCIALFVLSGADLVLGPPAAWANNGRASQAKAAGLYVGLRAASEVALVLLAELID